MSTGLVLAPMKASFAMIRAGGKAAREYLERTGGNSPAAIYEAMTAEAVRTVVTPAAPQDERALFEAHWETLHGEKPVSWKRTPLSPDVPDQLIGCYICRPEQAAWSAWQARAARPAPAPADAPANECLAGQIYDLLIDGMAASEDHDDVRAAFARIGVVGEDYHRLMVANQKQREDVARYHWLRDENIGDAPEAINLNAARRGGLDAAIDAARPHGKRYDD